MAYRKCMSCGYLTGNTATHDPCPLLGATPFWEVCDCGSGGHPRRCALHPDAYDAHCADLSAENEGGDT